MTPTMLKSSHNAQAGDLIERFSADKNPADWLLTGFLAKYQAESLIPH